MVRCAECGFLGLRRGDGELIEVDARYRTKGVRDVPHDRTSSSIVLDAQRAPAQDMVDTTVPQCFARPTLAFTDRILGRYKKQGRLAEGIAKSTRVEPADVVQALDEDFACAKFMQWQHGRSPKEHQELLDGKRDRREQRLYWLVGWAVTVVVSLAAAIISGAVSGGWEPWWWPF